MKIKFYLALSLIIGTSFSVCAQPGFPPAVDDVTAPLPGLALAALIAVGLGLRKSLKSK
jgi:hypothetical protein